MTKDTVKNLREKTRELRRIDKSIEQLKKEAREELKRNAGE